MSAKAQDIPAALMQLATSTMIPIKQRRHLQAFIQTAQTPEDSSYEFEHSSGSAIDMLKVHFISKQFQFHLKNNDLSFLNEIFMFLFVLRVC